MVIQLVDGNIIKWLYMEDKDIVIKTKDLWLGKFMVTYKFIIFKHHNGLK